MILGYESPVDIPMLSIYDKGMMQMYLQALQKDYLEGREDWNKFIDKYGDLINSPIQGAAEAYYQAGVGGALDKVNLWEAMTGSDILRSQAGRALIEKFIREADRAKMSAIRASAENKQKYNESILALKLANKWNPEVEQLELQRLGMDPNNWDHSKVWDRTSAEPFTNYSTYFGDQFKNLPTILKEIKDPKTGEVIGRQNGVDENALKKMIDVAYPTYANSPSGRYELLNLKNQMKQLPQYVGYTDDMLNKELEKTMKDNLFKMGNKSSDYHLDPLYEKKIDLANDLKKISAQEASQKRITKYTHDLENSNPTMWNEIDKSPYHLVTIPTGDIERNNVEPVSSSLTPAPGRAGYIVQAGSKDVYNSNGKPVNIGTGYTSIEFRTNGTFTGTGKSSDGYKEHGYLVGIKKVNHPANGNKKAWTEKVETVISGSAHIKVRRRRGNYGTTKK